MSHTQILGLVRAYPKAVLGYGVKQMKEPVSSLTIGGVAKAAGVGVEALRYYQRRGLLPEPARPPGQVRRYGPHHVQRLQFIKAAQKLGFTLDEVAVLLQLDDGTQCAQARQLAADKLVAVRERLDALRTIERALVALVDSCESHRGCIACPLIAALSTQRTAAGETGASAAPDC